MRALLRVHESRIAGGLEERGSVRVLPEAAETAGPAPPRDRIVAVGGSTCAPLPRAAPTPAEPGRPVEAVAEVRSSLASLYHGHADFVYRLALRLLGSREEAEDLRQDVFATLCGPTSYDPGRGSMRAFLGAMTRWRAIDRLRLRGRSARLLETWPEAAPCGVAPAMPWEDVSMRRAAERVRGALAGLVPAHREVLELAYYRDLSQQEIAAELDAPLGTVKSWSRRALHELACVLEELRPDAAQGGSAERPAVRQPNPQALIPSKSPRDRSSQRRPDGWLATDGMALGFPRGKKPAPKWEELESRSPRVVFPQPPG